ncbi:activating transcription factor 7-interacting protein 1 isoform 2-T4 [Anableps anableps]
MEVVTEEKKKIFRARKTMKISDRLQLENLHSTLLNSSPGLSNPSPPPLVNGTHKEDGQKVGDREQNSSSDPNSPQAASPATPGSLSSPAPFLSLNLSPSPGSSQSPNPQEEATSQSLLPPSESHDEKKTEDEENRSSPPSPQSESAAAVSAECTEQQKEDTDVIPVDEIEEKTAAPEEPLVDLEKDSDKRSPEPSALSECIEPMDEENDPTNIDSEESTSTAKHEKPPIPGDAPSISSTSPPASGEDKWPTAESKEEDGDKASVEKESNQKEKMELNSVKVELKQEKSDAGQAKGPTRPSSTPPCNTDQEQKSSNSGLKRTLSEGNENDAVTVKREGKRPKVEHEELEAQLELKITAKASSQQKLEKIVQQLVNERLKILELTIFDKHFQELKDRVDKIDCATKHQTAINSLQSKIARLAKKFGEANQVSENKRKQEALATAAAAAAKAATVTNNSQAQRPVRTSVEVKQTPATVASSSTAVVPVAAPLPVSTVPPASASAPTLAPASSSTIVPQGSILQLITSSSNAASTLATGITTQSQPGTLVLKTTPGSSMVTAGQPLVIQLPLSVNGQTGTLVNFPVSSLAAATSLNKAKTTPSTTTFILKPSPAANAASAPTSTAAALPTLQASSGQVATTQISLARAVYQGGAGRITTPNAGVSVTTVRAPAQSVSVAGAVSSASSPATSGPAATGSTAPGTPQGASLTSKTDNQAAATTPSKAAAPPPPARPKGSVIDLTEDDDDVQVTGVKNAQGATPSSASRSNPVISIPNKMPLERLNMDSDDSGGQSGLEEESDDSDDYWVDENSSSSESELEDDSRKKRHPKFCDGPTKAVTKAELSGHTEPPFATDANTEASLMASVKVENIKEEPVWTAVEPAEHPGKLKSENVLTEAAGPTPYAKHSIDSALTAFLCIIDSGMLKHISKCTVAEAHKHQSTRSWDMTVVELKAFIGLLYIRGAKGAKYMDLDSLWSEKWGYQFFKETMSRNRFKEIMRFLSFEQSKNRRAQLLNDRISTTWNTFVENCIACYNPGADITIEEQLFPTKAKCKFIQYVAHKPSKFGIKFWLAVDVESKYMLNGAPYLGEEETLLEEDVVLKLAEPFMRKGRNITTDGFFTSLKLATTSQPRKTRKNTSSLSTVDPDFINGLKEKPESVQHGNNTKYGGDILDPMARKYSVKRGTRRWYVAVFYNILDLAGINAHVLFQLCTGTQITRRRFLQQLGEELRVEFMEARQSSRQVEQSLSHLDSKVPKSLKRKQCQVRKHCNKNKTSDICSKCRKAVCGSCARRTEVICTRCEL